jgi:hypothetical protein
MELKPPDWWKESEHESSADSMMGQLCKNTPESIEENKREIAYIAAQNIVGELHELVLMGHNYLDWTFIASQTVVQIEIN